MKNLYGIKLDYDAVKKVVRKLPCLEWWEIKKFYDKPSKYIYFIYHDDFLLYVGATDNVRRRLAAHHIYKKYLHNIKVLELKDDWIDKENLFRCERLVIDYYKPPLNDSYNNQITYSKWLHENNHA
jgi:hypothetical protein